MPRDQLQLIGDQALGWMSGRLMRLQLLLEHLATMEKWGSHVVS